MMKNRLRVGLLLDDYQVPAWAYKMFEKIINSEYAEIDLVVVNDNQKPKPNKTILSKLKHNYGRITSLLVRRFLEALYRAVIERHTNLPDAHELINSEALFKTTSTLKVKTIRKQWSDYFHNDDMAIIKQHDIDILVRCGFGILRGDILRAAKYGVWSFHHGDNRVNRGGPFGFWESMESWPETGSILQILTEDLDNGKVLYRSFSRTDTMSLKDNASNYFWKSLSFMTRKMKELHEKGEAEFFKTIEEASLRPVFYSERLYIKPTNYELAKLTLGKIFQKLRSVCLSKGYINDWIVMFHLKDGFSSSLWRYKKLIPPKDRYWADPHIIYREGKYYIFIEEYMCHSRKGHISLITMDEKGKCTGPEVILDRPYHLSYPFAFEHEGSYYMIPESSSNRTIELYKCIEFPNKWEFQMNLMENVSALDATCYYHNNKWWMFANVIENEGASSDDELFLFYSSDLFSSQWHPHPLNPIVSDCKNARPAGKIFSEYGKLYRPSQNCSVRYGYGFNINEITTLSETNYAETLVSRVRPNWDKHISSTHTFNRVNRLHVIDGQYRRRRFFRGALAVDSALKMGKI